MIGTIDIEIQAANPQMPLVPVRAYKNSPTSVRLRNVPKAIGDWKITSVQIVALYPNNATKTANCVLVGGVWVGTIEGCDRAGKVESGFTVYASGIDENENPVSNYVLGKGLVEILDGEGTIDPSDNSNYVHLFDAEPSTPKTGDFYPTTSGYAIWQDGEAHIVDAGATALAQDAYDLASSAMSLASEANAVATSAATMAEGVASCVPSEATSSNQLADKAWVSTNVSSLESSIVGGSVVANKATNTLELVDSLASQPSTRVIIDEHGNAVVQKYVQSGWYVDHAEVRIGAGEYTTTTDYWCTVDAKTTDDGLEFTLKAQDYARALPVKTSSLTSTDQTITEISHVIYLNQSETGVVTYLKIYCSYSSSPMWVNVSRLVPDEGTQCGLKASQITNDGTFVTQQQVEPSPTFSKWARGAESAIWLLGNRGAAADPTKQVFIEQQSGKLNIVNLYYPSWYLTKYNGTTLDTPIELKWGYYENTSFMLNRRQHTITINSWAWVATTLYPNTGNTKNRFYIKANANEAGIITSLDDKFYVSATAHDITFSSDEKSIATFDGSSDSLECSRTDKARVENRKYFVLEDDLSSYATQAWTTTQLATKQDALTQTQLSVINEGVDERKTVIKYVNDDVVSLDISGTIETSDIPDIGNVKEIKFGTTVTELGDQLIDYRAPYLSKVEIPDSVTNIGEYAFRTCGNLTDVKFGNGLQCIEEAAFNGCDLTTVELPESLKKIYAGAFSQNANLTTVYIPKYVDYLDFNIFYACPNAKIVFLDRTLEDVVNIGAYNGIKQYPWGVDKNRIYAIDSTDSYEFCTITPPEPDLVLGMYPITYSIQGVGYTVENGSELTITRTGAYYTVEHNNTTLGSTILLFTTDKNGVIESYGTSIDENSLRFGQQIIPPHSLSVLTVGTSYQLKNKAVNTINVSPDLLAKFDLIMPQEIGRARDFSVRVVADAGTYSEDPYLVAVNTSIINNGGELPEIVTASTTQCTTVVDFNEVASNKFVATSPNTLDGLEDLIDSI